MTEGELASSRESLLAIGGMWVETWLARCGSERLWARTQLNNDKNTCCDGTYFLFFGQSAKISLKFTDKEPIFADLSVSKPHFTDKPTFSGDLSVNFWPLWWGFTDRRLFLEHLSVKPRPKPLKSYGQTAVFAHFVRNRHFSGRPFTDNMPIFIDVSVKRQWFCQMQCCASSAQSLHLTSVTGKTFFLEFACNLRAQCFG